MYNIYLSFGYHFYCLLLGACARQPPRLMRLEKHNENVLLLLSRNVYTSRLLRVRSSRVFTRRTSLKSVRNNSRYNASVSRFQATTRQGWRRLVSEKYGNQGRQGIPRSESAHSAFTDVHQDARQIRQWQRGRVHRGVLCRVLATRVQQVGAMEESTWYRGKYRLARSSIESRSRFLSRLLYARIDCTFADIG